MTRYLVSDGKVAVVQRGGIGWSVDFYSTANQWTHTNGKGGLDDAQASKAIKMRPDAIECATWADALDACRARQAIEAQHAATAAAYGFSD